MDEGLPVAVVVDGPAPGHEAGVVPVSPSRRRGLDRSLSRSHTVNSTGVEFLISQGIPHGLRRAVIDSCHQFSSRIWVLDNSGSMGKCDGRKVLHSAQTLLQCSRWEELCQTVAVQVDFGLHLNAPFYFRLLNKSNETGKQYFEMNSEDLKARRSQAKGALEVMDKSYPHSATPIAAQLRAIHSRIVSEAPTLAGSGKRVVLVLATDGLPSDKSGVTNAATKREFRDVLRRFQGLPVWVVVRLCTDDDSVVEYWNDIDTELELPLEVLDDWLGESVELHQHNPWLNYPQILHSIREMGFSNPLFDFIDERRLDVSEMMRFMLLLFGDACKELPDPRVDYVGFEALLSEIVQEAGTVLVISPKFIKAVSRGMSPNMTKIQCEHCPWINLKVLRKLYKEGSSTCTIC